MSARWSRDQRNWWMDLSSGALFHPSSLIPRKKKRTSQTKYKPTAGCSTCSQLKRKKNSTICCLNRHMHCDVTDINLLYSLSQQRGQRSAVRAAGRLFGLLFCVASALISCRHERLEPAFTWCHRVRAAPLFALSPPRRPAESFHQSRLQLSVPLQGYNIDSDFLFYFFFPANQSLSEA